MHLTFPHFTIDQPIQADGDLKVNLDPMEKQDWYTQDFACDRKTPTVPPRPPIVSIILITVYSGRAMTRA